MKIKNWILIVITGILITGGCNEPWDERFADSVISDETILETIKSKPEYSGFLSLLQETGYDTILQLNTAYTVFLPTGNAFSELTGASLEEKKRIAASHISNTIIYSNEMNTGSKIKSLSGKYLTFSQLNNAISINNESEIISKDLRTTNGVIHVISNLQPVYPSIHDFILQESSYSHIADYFNNSSTLIFDKENSIPLGLNNDGLMEYDSAFRISSPFFAQFADISSEDEKFTIFLANNTLLDTTENGELKTGFIGGISAYIFEGAFDEGNLPTTITSVTGIPFTPGNISYEFVAEASNGKIYKVNSLSGLKIPQKILWEITDISDFDSIRNIRVVEYRAIYEQLTELRISELNGSISNLRYAFDFGAYNNDYLRLITSAGTFVTIDLSLPNINPGRYNVKMNAQIRLGDGIVFDNYINGQLTKSDVSLNSGSYTFEFFDLGEVTITQESNNVLTMKLKGTNPLNTRGFIDYFLFEPAN